MAMIVPFPGSGATTRPADPGPPAKITILPSHHVRRAYLRREGLRLAAGGGLVSIPEIARRLRAWHAEAGLLGPEVEADVADAIAFVLEVRDAALRAVDGSRPSPDGSGRVA